MTDEELEREARAKLPDPREAKYRRIGGLAFASRIYREDVGGCVPCTAVGYDDADERQETTLWVRWERVDPNDPPPPGAMPWGLLQAKGE